MGKKSNDVDLIGQLFSNKDLLTKIMSGEVEEKEIMNILKGEDKSTPEYVVKELLANHLIKYFRERFYIFNDKIWEIQDDRQHIAVKKLINCILKQNSINYSKSFVNDCVELLMSEVESFKNETTRYLISLVSGYNSNNNNWLQESTVWFSRSKPVSTCIIGTCSNAVTLKICKIV